MFLLVIETLTAFILIRPKHTRFVFRPVSLPLFPQKPEHSAPTTSDM
jgi:hypothetical protein